MNHRGDLIMLAEVFGDGRCVPAMLAHAKRQGLQSLKERGVKLGTPRWNLERLVEGKKEKHRQDCQKVSDVIVPLRRRGMSLRGICEVLNSSGMTTERGTRFHPSLVSRMVKTLEVG